MSNFKEPGFVAIERLKHFASRHGTERGDDPVFDELYDYAGLLYECLQEAIEDKCEQCKSSLYGACVSRDGSQCSMITRWRKALWI